MADGGRRAPAIDSQLDQWQEPGVLGPEHRPRHGVAELVMVRMSGRYPGQARPGPAPSCTARHTTQQQRSARAASLTRSHGRFRTPRPAMSAAAVAAGEADRARSPGCACPARASRCPCAKRGQARSAGQHQSARPRCAGSRRRWTPAPNSRRQAARRVATVSARPEIVRGCRGRQARRAAFVGDHSAPRRAAADAAP